MTKSSYNTPLSTPLHSSVTRHDGHSHYVVIRGRSQPGVVVVVVVVVTLLWSRREESDEEERWWPGCDCGLCWPD